MLVASKGADKRILMADRAGFRRPEASPSKEKASHKANWESRGVGGGDWRLIQQMNRQNAHVCFPASFFVSCAFVRALTVPDLGSIAGLMTTKQASPPGLLGVIQADSEPSTFHSQPAKRPGWLLYANQRFIRRLRRCTQMEKSQRPHCYLCKSE